MLLSKVILQTCRWINFNLRDQIEFNINGTIIIRLMSKCKFFFKICHLHSSTSICTFPFVGLASFTNAISFKFFSTKNIKHFKELKCFLSFKNCMLIWNNSSQLRQTCLNYIYIIFEIIRKIKISNRLYNYSILDAFDFFFYFNYC